MRTLSFALLLVTGCWAQARNDAYVSGIVADAMSQRPIHGATVTVGPLDQPAVTARTDAVGRYSITNVPATVVYVSVSSPGYLRPEPHSVSLNLSRNKVALQNFELRPAPAIRGIITDFDTGTPMRGCQVFAFRKIVANGEAWYRRSGNSTVDTKTGQFEITDVAPGDYVLEFSTTDGPIADGGSIHKGTEECHGSTYYHDPGHAESATPLTINEVGNKPLALRLLKPLLRSISGTVSLPRGWDTKYFAIMVSRFDLDGDRRTEAAAVQSPVPFRLTNLTEGDYTLLITDLRAQRIFAPDWNKGNSETYFHDFIYEKRIRIGDHDLTDIEIALLPSEPVVVTGTVAMEDGSKLRSGVQMMLYSLNGEIEIRSSVSKGPFDAAVPVGSYWPRLRGLPRGYAVTKVTANGRNISPGPVLADTTPLSLTFSVSTNLGRVSGTALGAEGTSPHYPAAGGSVALIPEPIGDRVDPITSLVASPNQEGGFAFNDVPPGTYRAVVLSEREAPLYRNPFFLRRAALAARTIEVNPRETTHVSLNP